MVTTSWRGCVYHQLLALSSPGYVTLFCTSFSFCSSALIALFSLTRLIMSLGPGVELFPFQ